MEDFDVAIIGGGTAGLAALKQLANLGHQAVLIEAGKDVGTKNVSGGILYSKKPRHGKVYNAEDVFGSAFLQEAPFERKITKYVLHATSGNKDYSIDLTRAHEYQANYGCSVLLNKLIAWFGTDAEESAQRFGGGIVSGVHVKGIRPESDSEGARTIIDTDELESFRCKAVIAADGVNSETAVMTGARPKFSPHELYQGVKVVVKMPEQIMEERFGIGPDEGAAHLFAGDVTLNHIGGGFVYTNRCTLSVGAVYHYDSLLARPAEPSSLVNALIMNPVVSEFLRDEVPVKSEIDKNLPKEEQLRSKFAVSKLVKNWTELRDAYYSTSGSQKLIESGKYKTRDEIKTRIDSIRTELESKYSTKFVSDYIELEYSAKLIPDGKRCMMKKPYHRNILFVGDAAGRGVFIGPRIEGLNVGIDDAVRASNAIGRAIERNDFSKSMGEHYSQSVEESPFTRDMKEIDKDYLKVFLDAARDVPKDVVGQRYGMIFKLMSSSTLRGLAIGLANILGYDRLLPLVESEDTYVQVPIEIAEKMGSFVQATYQPTIPSLAERIADLKYDDDRQSHITVTGPRSDFMKKMVVLCPTGCYSQEPDGKVMLQHEACVECGTCAKETEWHHPRGEKGVIYQYG